jgi:hypothetical protein
MKTTPVTKDIIRDIYEGRVQNPGLTFGINAPEDMTALEPGTMFLDMTGATTMYEGILNTVLIPAKLLVMESVEKFLHGESFFIQVPHLVLENKTEGIRTRLKKSKKQQELDLLRELLEF